MSYIKSLPVFVWLRILFLTVISVSAARAQDVDQRYYIYLKDKNTSFARLWQNRSNTSHELKFALAQNTGASLSYHLYEESGSA